MAQHQRENNIINMTLDNNGERSFTLATADTYVDKNIQVNVNVGISVLTEEEYNLIEVPDPNVLYVIVGALTYAL